MNRSRHPIELTGSPPDPQAQVLVVGEFTLTRCEGGYRIYHRSGEGGHFTGASAIALEAAIRQFYQEWF